MPIVLHANLNWRGLPGVPCEAAPYDFGHTLAERRYPYVDGAGHEHVGRDPIVVNARLFFQNHFMGMGPLYPEVWVQWRDALMDGLAGDLDHPDIGIFDARIRQVHVDVTSKNRSGVVVDVVITETVLDPEEFNFFGTPAIDPGAAAAEADAALNTARTLADYPDGVGDSDLLESWESVKGQVGSIGTSVSGKLNQMQGKVGGLIEDVNSLNDVELNPVSGPLLKLWGSLEDFKKTAEQIIARTTKTATTAHDTTLDALAAATGNTVNDLMGLNLALLKSPTIKKGTAYTFYAGSSLKSPIGG